ncbi:MAG: molecular chaperone SurA [Gammaproteobacteria bacterium]|nr:MAG: molecular chaperone SurA [Gammaproteobacteria bacterium]
MRLRSNLFSFFAMLAVISGACAPTVAEEVLIDSIAAVVDEDVVMASELDERVREIYIRMKDSNTQIPPGDVLIPQVLERLILERIQLSRGQRAGVRISDDEVNQSIARLAQSRGMTVDQMVEHAHQNGISLRRLRDQIRTEMIIKRVQEGLVNRRINVSEQEIDNFLKSEEGQQWSSPDVNLGHIILPLSAGAPRDEVAMVENKARELFEQLQGGADFRSIAIANSSGQNALQGGDLGWRKTTQLPTIFITAIDKLLPGEVSVPIRSDAGYHILKLYDRRGGSERIVLQHHVRHILIKPNEIRTEEDTKAMLEGIRADVMNGADFAELARENSEDIGTALAGGSLGWSVPGQFVPEFEETMNNIGLNDVSEPFRSQFGWHILQVTERRRQDFSEDLRRSQAKNILHQRKFEEELQIWLQEIRDEAFVDIKL